MKDILTLRNAGKTVARFLHLAMFFIITFGLIAPHRSVLALLSEVRNLQNLRAFVFPDTFVGTKIKMFDRSFEIYPGSFYDDLEGIKDFAAYSWIFFIRDHLPKNAIFLVYRIAEFAYYCDRPFVRDIENQMLPFYLSKTKDEATSALRNLKIEYIVIPKSPTATIYNSFMPEIVGDPSIAEVKFDSKEMQIVHLKSEPKYLVTSPVSFFNTVSKQDELSSRMPLSTPTVSYQMESTDTTASVRAINLNDHSVILGAINKRFKNRSRKERVNCHARAPLKENRLYRIQGTAKGEGLLSIKLEMQNAPKYRTEHLPLWESVLTTNGSKIITTFSLPSPSCFQNLIFKIGSTSHMEISGLGIEEISFEASDAAHDRFVGTQTSRAAANQTKVKDTALLPGKNGISSASK